VNDSCFFSLSWVFPFVLQSDNGIACWTKLELCTEFNRSLFVNAALNYSLCHNHTQYFVPVDLMSLCMAGFAKRALRDTGLTIIAGGS
jgi:hypothetical protein